MNKLDEAVAAVEAAKKKLLEEQLPNLTDTVLTLDERWAIFVKLTDAGVLPHDTYSDGHLRELQGTHSELTQYDDFHNDRGETVKFVDMYARLLEESDYFEGCDVDGWREYVLGRGFGSFDYDW